METIAIANRKGGVGKSTTAAALASGLKRKGYSVLAVDLDSQVNLTSTFQALGFLPTIHEVLRETAKITESVIETDITDLVPGSADMAKATLELKGKGAELKLREALTAIAPYYDYCILDTAPSLDIVTTNALIAADKVLIPTTAEEYSLQGIGQIMQSIETVRQSYNSSLQVCGILITNYPTNGAILGKDLSGMLEESAPELQTKVYKTRIRSSTPIKEAQRKKQDIFTYSPRSNAAKDYSAFIEEFLEKEI